MDSRLRRNDGSNSQSSIFNRQSFSVSPEQFEVVVVTIFGVEDVDHDVNVVEQDPSGLFVAGPAEALHALFLRHNADLVGDGAHLPVARAGGDDKIIGRRGYIPQIQNGDLATMALESHFRRRQCEFFRLQILPFRQILYPHLRIKKGS